MPANRTTPPSRRSPGSVLRAAWARFSVSLTPREQTAAILVAALFLLGVTVRFVRHWGAL